MGGDMGVQFGFTDTLWPAVPVRSVNGTTAYTSWWCKNRCTVRIYTTPSGLTIPF